MQAGPNDLPRAVHGLLYAQDLIAGGHEVRVVFEGAGTAWVKKMGDPSWKYHGLYRDVKGQGLIQGVCQYCAGVLPCRGTSKQGAG